MAYTNFFKRNRLEIRKNLPDPFHIKPFHRIFSVNKARVCVNVKRIFLITVKIVTAMQHVCLPNPVDLIVYIVSHLDSFRVFRLLLIIVFQLRILIDIRSLLISYILELLPVAGTVAALLAIDGVAVVNGQCGN